jgi:hypothetical protein
METVTSPHTGVGTVSNAARNAMCSLLAIAPVIALVSAFIVAIPVSVGCLVIANAHYQETFGAARNTLAIARVISVVTLLVAIGACVLLMTFRDPALA